MADIISFDKKLKRDQNKKEAVARRRKIQAVQRVFQCTQCSFKCERCGTPIDPSQQDHSSRKNHRIPYHFCDSCREEYIDYIEKLKGGGNKEWYWHNKEWLRLWRNWIAYQSSVDEYLKSREFKELVQELRQPDPEITD